MCTYRITIDDTLLEKAKDAFANEAEISSWMQAQLEILLLQIAERIKPQKRQKESISKKLRGIAKAPDSFDYKEELGIITRNTKDFELSTLDVIDPQIFLEA